MNNSSISQNNIPKDAKKMTKEERQIITEGVKNGTIKHKQIEQGIKNLIPLNKRSPEERKEIARKGALALKEIRGERKNAKQILEELLPIYAKDSAIDDNELISDDIKRTIKENNIKLTQYDLIMLAMISKAQLGDVKASEYISNHFGDTVVKETHNINESISVSDKALIDKISKRLNIVEADYKEVNNTND